MKREFIPYELALELKELGFNEPCLASYNHAGKRLDIREYINHGEYTVLAPVYSQAFRWFREKHGLVSWISFRIDLQKKYLWYITDVKDIVTRDCDYIFDLQIESYEESEIACLKKLIEIVKEGKK